MDLGNGILYYRLLRMLACILSGAFLALTGSALQVMLRNPLADPFVLGISSGGAFGIVLCTFFGWAELGLLPGVFSFLGCALAVLLLFLGEYIASKGQGGGVLAAAGKNGLFGQSSLGDLLLMGFVLNALFSALSMIFFALASPFQIASVQRWLMGAVQVSSYQEIGLLCLVGVPVAAILLRKKRDIVLLSFGEEYAQSLGLNSRLLIRVTLFLVATLVGIVVSTVGSVGFVGLIAPHVSRMLGVGNAENRFDWMASMLLGSALLVLADLLARLISQEGDFPLGVFTSLLGAPIMGYLLIRSRHNEH